MTARVARAIQKRRCDRRSGNFFPQKRFLLLVHGAAVGERTESERREDENDRARVPIIERAKCICRLGVFECVRECACSEALRFAFKR
jgi:hypothetical protein